MLALVAAAGRKGISRDRVLGILWPESDPELARHALSQRLYSLRRETGHDLIGGAAELRLDPSISSDIGELLDAVAEGDPAAAAALYSGAFLDGFYLPGATEFERWVEEERAALHGLATRAMEQAVKAAKQAGRLEEAVHWAHRLTELDPLSARYAASYMEVLVASGDRAQAIAHARAHQEAVRRELDADLEPGIRHLLEQLRAPAPVSPVTASAKAPGSALSTGSHAPEPSVPLKPALQPPLPPEPARRSRWIAGLAAGVGVILLAVAIRAVLPGASPPPPFLAVGTIRTSGLPDSALSPVLRDMLATGLGGVPGLQVVANSRVIELIPRGADTTPGATTDAARRAGATELIEGEVGPGNSGFVLTLRRVTLNRGIVRNGYVVRGADRYALVDSATAAIARDLGVAARPGSVSDIRTSSPAAYALYEEGLRAYYKFDAAAAYRLMSAAVERDSGFAMAAYYAWQSSRGITNQAETDRVMLLAKRLAGRAIDRERLLILGSVAALDAPLARSVAIAETLSVRYPTDPDGQILLGRVRFAQGEWSEAVAALERAVRLDSAAGALAGSYCRVCLAFAEMTNAYMWWDSAGAAERSARRQIALRPDDRLGWINLAEPLSRLGRRTEAEAAYERAAALSTTATMAEPQLQRDLIRWGRYEEVNRELLSDLHDPSLSRRKEARWLLLFSLLDQGRRSEAAALTQAGRVPDSGELVPGLTPEPVELALIALLSDRWSEAARGFRGQADQTRAAQAPPGLIARVATWQLALAATAYAEAGDTARVRQLADTVRVLGQESSFGRDERLHHVLRGLLLQRAGRHQDAVDAFGQGIFSTTDGYTRTNLMMARSLLALGRNREAIAILQPALRGGVDGSNSYVSRTELHEALAQAFEVVGQADSATAHYRAVERAWRRADPEFRERYLRAKAKAGKGV